MVQKNGSDASIFQLLAASNFCKKALNCMYPETQNPGVNIRIHNQIFFHSGQIYYPENPDGMINILWTHTSDTNLQGWKPNHFMSCFPRILLSVKEIAPQRDTDPMFAEDEGQPKVKTQSGDDSQCKNNGGKEQAIKKQYMAARYDAGSKVPEKLDRSWYINDTNVTAEIKYALIQNRAPPVGFKFPPKEYKDKRRSSRFIKRYCQHSWFTDFDFISYSTNQGGLYCAACVLFHTETQREQPHVLVYKPFTN